MKINYSNRPKLNRRSFGFTLVELLVVMLIIATLASIGYGVFFKLRDSAKEKETTVFLKNIRSNMEAVNAETGIPYPANAGDLYSYLTGDESYFRGLGYQYADNMKPAMAELLPGQAGSKFVSDSLLVDSWKREIKYSNPGVRHNYDDGFDLQSDGVDPANDADDIEL